MKHTKLDAMGWPKKLGSTANEQQTAHKPSLLSQTPSASPFLVVARVGSPARRMGALTQHYRSLVVSSLSAGIYG